MTAALVALATALGAALALLVRAWLRPPAPTPREVAVQHLEQERAAAETEHTATVEAVEERHAAESARDPVELGNEIIRERRRRRGGLLLVPLLLASQPARAADEPCIVLGQTVVCEREGYADLIGEIVDLRRERDLARADAVKAQRELAACTAVVVTPATPRPVWPLVVVGAVGVVAGVVVGVAVGG